LGVGHAAILELVKAEGGILSAIWGLRAVAEDDTALADHAGIGGGDIGGVVRRGGDFDGFHPNDPHGDRSGVGVGFGRGIGLERRHVLLILPLDILHRKEG